MAHREKVLHGYRRILRATTYVPDSFARAYVHDFIAARFKANCSVAGKPNAEALLANRLKKLRSWTRVLESAGHGSVKDLEKVLQRVHGRQGARKRVLLRELLQPDENLLPKDDKALEELMNNPPKAEGSRLEFKKGTKLHAIAKSQTEHHPTEHIKAKLKLLKPKIPEENIWGRPTPRKLAQNLTKRWWAATIDKLLPPIPTSEWERLRDFATGAVSLEEAPARRSRGKALVAPRTREPRVDSQLLLDALRSPARPNLVGIQKLEFDASKGIRILDAPEPVTFARNLRSIRRMYAGIWIISPIVTQDEVTKRWTVQWGGHRSKALNGAISKPTPQEQELFEGIDGYEDTNEQLPSNWRMRALRKKQKQKEAHEAGGHIAELQAA